MDSGSLVQDSLSFSLNSFFNVVELERPPSVQDDEDFEKELDQMMENINVDEPTASGIVRYFWCILMLMDIVKQIRGVLGWEQIPLT